MPTRRHPDTDTSNARIIEQDCKALSTGKRLGKRHFSGRQHCASPRHIRASLHRGFSRVHMRSMFMSVVVGIFGSQGGASGDLRRRFCVMRRFPLFLGPSCKHLLAVNRHSLAAFPLCGCCALLQGSGACMYACTPCM